MTQLFPENLTINGTMNNDRISHRTMVHRENKKHQRGLNDHHGTVSSPLPVTVLVSEKLPRTRKTEGNKINENLKKTNR